ncbi:MAG: sodium:solute symporter family protein, partial [Longimicrobiales bacterium]
MNPLLAVLIGVGLVYLIVGLRVARRSKTAEAFFVGDRKLGAGLIFSTLLAANIGAGTTVNATALGYSHGLSAWWWVGSAGLGSLVLAWWIGPKIRRRSAEAGLRTLGDYLEWRYSPGVRTLGAALLVPGSLFLLAVQLAAMGLLMQVVVGTPYWVGVVIGGSIATAYFAAGGLAGAARVNALQLVLEYGGFFLLIPFAILVAGGWGEVVDRVPTGDYWHFTSSGPAGLWYLVMLGPAFIVSPGLLQKVYGAADDRAVRVGVGLNALALLLFAAVPPLLGIVARAQFPDLADPQLALPTLLQEGVPAWVGALGVAAVFSAELSTCDAILFMVTTSVSQDMLRPMLKERAREVDLLGIARRAALVCGALAVGLAVAAPNMVVLLTIFYSLLTAGLAVPLIAGLYTDWAGPRHAIAAMVGGMVGLVSARVL